MSSVLKKNSIGLVHIVFFVVAAAAPLTSIVGATPPAFAFGNGPGVPGAFILAGILYVIFSIGFTAMSRHVKGAGAFYTYISQGLGRPYGIAGALIAIVTYSCIQIATYALFGVFVNGALSGLGIPLPWWAWSAIGCVAVTLCGQRNVAFSGNLLGVCMVAEITVLAVLDIAVALHGKSSGGLIATPFAPATVFAPGLGAALVFVIGSYVGFEATAIFSEETRNPERTIPRATYLAVLLITVFYAISSWAAVQFYGPAEVTSAAKAHLDSFYFTPASVLLGTTATQVMKALLITSLFASVLSFHNTINRYLFALGREGLVWRPLGAVHPVHGSPACAGLVQSAIAVIAILGFALGHLDPYAVVFSWMAALGVIGIITVQILVCCAVILFFHRDARGVSVGRRLVAPGVATLGLGGSLVLVISNLPLLAGSDSPLIASFPWIIATVGLAGVALAGWLKHSKPALYESLGRIFEA